MKNILITGKRGYIATALHSELQNTYNVTCVGREELDLTESLSTRNWFANTFFDVVIHTAISGGHRSQNDTTEVLDENLRMYYNLLDNRSNFGKFINIGSGAELMHTDTPYGLSKHIIRTSLLDKPDFYNLRVFAVFDENELNSRFIKTNIVNYIREHSMIIHQNKYMDFFYMKDFCSVVDYYITTPEPPKEYDCVYLNTVSLENIAKHINTLGDYAVDITIIAPGNANHYAAPYPRVSLPLNFVGLTAGITNVYNSLLCRK